MPRKPPAGSGESARKYAFDQLRQAILRGDLVPGQRMHEPEFAERFRVTRGSVRAAMIDLTAEGLVERVHHRGARVRVISLDEAVAIAECRMALEGLCASKAALLATDAQIDELNGLSDEMATAVTEGALTSYSALNRNLHAQLVAYSQQRSAGRVLERLNAQLVRHQYRLALLPGRPHQSLREHMAIIEAVRARDPQAAEAAARAHLCSVIQTLRSQATSPTPAVIHPIPV
ncbi:GntR family transcriptional regulator [Streptomyces sp. NPDC047061]|uniref:GntR family transcriptional regulator n=1 Tax=Streptomyces sp. NPDC047061 TaxID=3154605 RepID=UPI0033CECDDE